MIIDSYELVTASSKNGLNNLVERYIKEGWQPFGAPQVNTVFITYSGGSGKIVYHFSQALVMYKK